ncbi:predicted protein [Plenodomus lingam JN3]|uniref:Uncharacterized protein n=1 Tax=Leptosphaeria maculans (strain JN3 / isolate v23.1.3 / race Av1-4-5-6-7-8) TaxID=985895 RepID=E4ZGT7_LEPMJ|nr:predicted protein [Plenodomus lingam JN3]CBX90507.1 predicted protein [Plenodomus lingam JN3]
MPLPPCTRYTTGGWFHIHPSTVHIPSASKQPPKPARWSTSPIDLAKETQWQSEGLHTAAAAAAAPWLLPK